MVLTLYYTRGSPPARIVDLVLHALNLPVEYKIVSLYNREHLTPDFAKIHPLHRIPALDDDGFVIWETRAIITYLVSKYGKDDSLYPKDLQKRAIVDQRLHYSNDVFYALKQVIKPALMFNVKGITEEQVTKIRECQENIEKLLQGHDFMAGDSLTLADYCYITNVDLLEVYSPTGDKFPLTKAWVERCKSTMKDFDKVNKQGAEELIAAIKSKLDSQ